MYTTCQKINWYAFYVRSRSEKQVLARLEEGGFDAYLPLITRIKQWSDRKKKVQEPLIKSYVFVKTEEISIREVLKVPGIIFALKYLGKPAVVREKEIQNLRILTSGESEMISILPITELIVGDRIRVMRGPFSGLEGDYIRMKGNYRVIVRMETLGTMISVDIPANYIEKM